MTEINKSKTLKIKTYFLAKDILHFLRMLSLFLVVIIFIASILIIFNYVPSTTSSKSIIIVMLFFPLIIANMIYIIEKTPYWGTINAVIMSLFAFSIFPFVCYYIEETSGIAYIFGYDLAMVFKPLSASLLIITGVSILFGILKACIVSEVE